MTVAFQVIHRGGRVTLASRCALPSSASRATCEQSANFADLDPHPVNAPSIACAHRRSCPPGTLCRV